MWQEKEHKDELKMEPHLGAFLKRAEKDPEQTVNNFLGGLVPLALFLVV